MMNMHPSISDDQFRDLYGRYFARVQRFLVKFGMAPDDARDLAQETFIRFYESKSTYRGDAEWAYLETIARNLLYNRVRSQHTAKRAADLTSLEDAPEAYDVAVNGSQEERVLQKELQARLSAAIAALPSGVRECLILSIEGLSYGEIAQALRISADAVKTRLYEARRRLRLSFEEATDSDASQNA
jgi:RNA polymerase sigma factor (sigma-70 family)